ncbi:MAG: hypothetical protein RQ763_08995 [Sulfurimonas sp.]|uniref:hypothetical protein n=1 Tax=Sulfurimonas sp. TaxID=2022749 RepID=UPI0028CF4A55|nr:hypothetical protein [Sulfurimonas sp.]MDT8339322.1 hypothetical protein [Sulfurimonas sp.]
MKSIVVNGEEYKFRCVAAMRKSINQEYGVLVQLQIAKDGKVLNKKEVSSYVIEKIEEYIRELI